MTKQSSIPRLDVTVNSEDDPLLIAIEDRTNLNVIFECKISRHGIKIVYWRDNEFNYYRTVFKRSKGEMKYIRTINVPASIVIDIVSLV